MGRKIWLDLEVFISKTFDLFGEKHDFVASLHMIILAWSACHGLFRFFYADYMKISQRKYTIFLVGKKNFADGNEMTRYNVYALNTLHV
jgi:hypothetical protein